jgi:hypothetical protein
MKLDQGLPLIDRDQHLLVLPFSRRHGPGRDTRSPAEAAFSAAVR